MAEIYENLMQSLNQNWFYIFSGQADQTRQSSRTQNRLYVSEICRKREANAINKNYPSERVTVIIKIIHFLMRLKTKQSIEMPKQSIENVNSSTY